MSYRQYFCFFVQIPQLLSLMRLNELSFATFSKILFQAYSILRNRYHFLYSIQEVLSCPGLLAHSRKVEKCSFLSLVDVT